MLDPEDDVPQYQPLTVLLRNICRDYPAGGGILKELLQNADDAGASEVRFILDDATYPSDQLLYPELSQHQGPALLAYNSGLFSKKDFSSLARVGDSLKRDDESTTGRFGLGFNSVYNWTDSPSIISGDQLKILDPHQRFSKGGPSWNFVNESGRIEVKNQMAAFSKVIDVLDRPFLGTVIRIPLRTSNQAPHSEIVKRAVTASEVAEVMRQFVSEFKTTGLLFMKNVEKIIVSLDDEEQIEMKISNACDVREQRKIINSAIKELGKPDSGTYSLSFEVDIETTWAKSTELTRFCVHHLVGEYPQNEDLKNWSISHSFLPWVAVASQLSPRIDATWRGSFFTVLPLPIATNQPVHIHGSFSLSSDRSQLSPSSDSTVQDKMPARWNQWLIDELVPTAWVDLLVFLKEYPDQQAYGTWPRLLQDIKSTCYGSFEKVVNCIEKGNLTLWQTGTGFFKSEDALFSTGRETLDQLTAIGSVNVPIIHPSDDLRDDLRGHCKALPLNSRNLYGRLEKEHVKRGTEETKRILLDYFLLQSSRFVGYGALELFPFEDGLYKSIENIAFVHRDDEERNLFRRAKSHNLNLDRISSKAKMMLKNNLSGLSRLHRSLQYRSTAHFKDYLLKTIFNHFDEDEDAVTLDEESQEFVRKSWDWIEARAYSLDENISGLWLLPLSNDTYRKIMPKGLSSFTVYTRSGQIDTFLRHLATIKLESNKPMIRDDELSYSSRKLIAAAASQRPSLQIRIGDSFDGLLRWFNDIREVVSCLPDSEKHQIQGLLASKLAGTPNKSSATHILRRLNIFERLVWKDDNTDIRKPTSTWTSLDDSRRNNNVVVGIVDTIPVPGLSANCFLDARSKAVRDMLSKLGVDLMTTLRFLSQIIIPSWQSHLLDSWSLTCKRHIAELLLKNYVHLQGDYGSQIKALSFIPAASINCRNGPKFSTAADLVDPSKGELMALFFDSEEVRPATALISEYRGVLIQLGLKLDLDDKLVENRVRAFHQNRHSLGVTWKRARNLLQLASPWASRTKSDAMLIIRSLSWLPATGIDGQMILTSAENCRSLDDRSLVADVLPILNFAISEHWKKLLGWDTLIPDSVLLQQLRKAIEKEDRKVVDAVLTYVDRNERFDEFSELLTDVPCVLAVTGDYVLAKSAFERGCRELSPYLYDVSESFWETHESLLETIGVQREPTLQALLDVQNRFEINRPLEEDDIKVHIKLIELASTYPRSELSSLRIVNDEGSLSLIDDIVYTGGTDKNPFSASTVSFVSTHPDLPFRTIKRLGIESEMEKMMREEFSAAEIGDEEEFFQHEDHITSISDTLDRYRVESTFREYLANAEDTGDSHQINWLLDETKHPGASLLTRELQSSQGPALLAHNDAVFTEKDFEGFKNVGRGSKRDNPNTIGKFGRGAQTMYHWTDVPMLLSGKYLMILDPLQQVLPRRVLWGPRVPGLKITLSWFRKQCPDQLAPFDGLWGFSRDMDEYRGTIFRFPLRLPNSESRMRCNLDVLDSVAVHGYMDKFWDEARISLLFLRNVSHVDFKVSGEEECRWSITSSRESDDYGLSESVTCTLTRRSPQSSNVTAEDRWWVATHNLREHPTGLHYRHERRMKSVQCAMAALVSTKSSNCTLIRNRVPDRRFFSTLPLPFLSNLPVNIHATFLTSGDRQSIPIEKSMQDAGADFNRWLLTSAIPNLYFAFLEDLGRKMGRNVFRFWPKTVTAANTPEELICNSFWTEFLSQPNVLYKLYPSSRRDSRSETDPVRLLDANEAIFDFLPSHISKVLSGLLEFCIPNLVRIPEKLNSVDVDGLPGVSVRIIDQLRQRASELSIVTPKMIREILKSSDATEYLENVASNAYGLHKCLLDFITPPVDANEVEFDELKGCRILPLVDGSLGTIQALDPWSPTEPIHRYYVADDVAIELFPFASDLLVRQKPGEALKHKLMEEEYFNLSRLDLDNVGNLLQRKSFDSNLPTEEMDLWLGKFWNVWREAKSQKEDLSIAAFPIFEATRNGEITYEKLSLDTLPAVVEPSNEDHQALCDRIPSLYRFNPILMPASIAEDELSFDKSSSFAHFVQALGRIAMIEGLRLDDFIIAHFSLKHLKTLRSLVMTFMSPRASSRRVDIDPLIKLIPLFPAIDQSGPWICADKVFLADDKRLIVPWMMDYNRFVDANHLYEIKYQPLIELIPGKMTKESLLLSWLLPRLPESLTAHSMESYVQFIYGIREINRWRDYLSSLVTRRLAPGCDLRLRTASSLFDHHDPVFASAFRFEKQERFLHAHVRQHRQFWLEIGLAQRIDGSYKADDYILCLQKISQRLDNSIQNSEDATPSQDLLSDVESVLEPLTHGFHALSRLGRSHWVTVRQETLIPALTDVDEQVEYRRHGMSMQAISVPLIKLENVLKHVYIPVCWTQTSFPLFEPSSSTFGKIPGEGIPGTEMVWRHLLTLSEISENLANSAVASFLWDLTRTYEYLQEHMSESCQKFMYRERKIWLNLDTTEAGQVSLEDIQSSWECIDHLLLKASYDSPPSMAVRQNLLNYERLLRALDCPAIKYDTITLPETPATISKSIALTRLRQEGKLLDATLSTEGKHIEAHRAVLAASSQFFETKYSGRWPAERPVDLNEIPYETLSTIVDFCYSDELNWLPMQVSLDEEHDASIIADKLDSLLDLYEAARFLLMESLAAQVENQILQQALIFIGPENVRDIRERAGRINAENLKDACKTFEELNQRTVDLVCRT